jgi:cytochrome c oxidase cbb3-type subunit III
MKPLIAMKNNCFKFVLTLAAVFSTSVPMWAQEAAAAGDSGFFTQLFANIALLATAILALAAVIAITQLLNSVVKAQQIKIYQEHGIESYLEEVKKEEGSAWQRFIQRWTKAVPVAKEQDVMLDHDYDGIRELDNSLPPWWVAMFYLTIGFAVVYMAYYHFSGAGPSSIDEYEIQMAKGEEAKERFLARQANKVDETNVVVLTNENDLALGKTIYDQNCVACHGMSGEGGVGPNMTDDYWIHGGGIADIFKTIKNGVPEKGMIAWSAQLRPADMQRVASYIMTMQGTNPPNGKAPEGDLYQPEAAAEPAAEDAEN